MNSYYFYHGPNKEYETIMRKNLKLLPSLKTKATVIDKIKEMNAKSHYCRNEVKMDYLTQELMRSSNAFSIFVFYIEDKHQNIIGVIVFNIRNKSPESVKPSFLEKRIGVEALCTPFSGGHGRRLMKYVIEFGKLVNMEYIRLDSKYSAVGFYKKMGFTLMPNAAKEYTTLVTLSNKFSVFSPRSRLSLPRSIDDSSYEMRFNYSTDYRKTLKTRSLRSMRSRRSTRNVRSI